MKGVEIHGFNVRDKGARTTGRVGNTLSEWGYDIDSDGGDYGWHFLFKVRFGFLHYEAIQRIKVALACCDFAFTHSNGANYFNQAANLLHDSWPEKKLLVVHISPALDADAPIPPNVEKAWFFHTPHDKAVKFSRLLHGHPWGDAGAVGYQGKDPRGSNVKFPTITGHSEWFRTDANVMMTATEIDKRLKAYRKAA